jgi:hypothetical protein
MAHTPLPDDEPAPNFTEHPDYGRLDDGIKELIGAKEFAWLPDIERSSFLRGCVEPEGFIDS